jgi:hypothetical protein
VAARRAIVEGADGLVDLALERISADDLRSVNAQIEMLLVDQARRAGR